jgi:hypothetical protein
MFSKERPQTFGSGANYATHTVTKEDLTLALGRAGVRCWIRLTYLKVGFYVNVRAFLEVTKVIVGIRIERKDVMPGSLGLGTN